MSSTEVYEYLRNYFPFALILGLGISFIVNNDCTGGEVVNSSSVFCE